jgi:uroporphyrinogen-III decarboxylase
MTEKQGERISRIKDLVAEVGGLAGSAENELILRRWQPEGRDVSVTNGASVWHGVPAGVLTKTSVVPFTIDPEPVFYAQALAFDLREYYLDPYCYLENTLKTKLYRYRTFGDDSYITKDISLFLGVVLEPSMFGITPIYPKGHDPWNSLEPVVKAREDIEKLRQPDFFMSGIMPRCHEFYSAIREALPDDFTVSFPLWGRGPWGVAQHLMGFEPLMIATVDEPETVHALMERITDMQCVWLSQRAEFLKIPLPVGAMYNDEVNCQVLSPAMYREFVFPYEQKVSIYQLGISYWHSCGDTAKILCDVKKLYGLQMFDVSAFISDWDTVAKELAGTGIAAEVRMHPVQDVLFCDEGHIRGKLKKVRDTFEGLNVTVRADGMQPMTTINQDTEKIRAFAAIAKEMLR